MLSFNRLILTFILVLFANLAMADTAEKRIAFEKERIKINFAYPITANSRINSDIEEWINEVVESFKREAPDAYDHSPYELNGSYEIIEASEFLYTIVWKVYTFTGGAHGNTDVISFIYNYKDGSILELQNLFADEQVALNILSAISFSALSKKLDSDKDMLKSGTSPDIDNFSAIAPIKDGLRIYFQPYQVAPYSYGIQQIDIDIDDLKEANPRFELWGIAKDKTK